MDEVLDLWIGAPLLAVNFVATDMEKLVGEKLGHLANECIEKFVSALARRIHRRIEHAPLPLNRIRPRPAGEVGISHEPRRAVTWHIEFRHNANPAIARILDHIPQLLLRVVQAIRAFLIKFWKPPALDPEALIIGKVPVQHIHLYRSHSIDVSLNNVHRKEMAA